MAKKISELVELLTPTGNDLLEIVNAGENKKITLTNLLKSLSDEVTRLHQNWSSIVSVPFINTVLPDYSVLNTLETEIVPSGRYQTDLAMLYTYDTTTKSAYRRVRITKDGIVGAWTTIRQEQQDVTDTANDSFFIIFDVATDNNTIKIETEMTRESGTDDLSVISNTIKISRLS